MVCGIIWADNVSLGGVEEAMGYEGLAIVTMKKRGKKSANRTQLNKDKCIAKISPYQE